MNNIRLLYLVQHTNKEMFKIGIATSNQRFHELNRDYRIDWNSSLYFKGEDTDITKLEKILHRLFHKKRLDKQYGTGGTEWFSSDCLESAIESILFNVTNSGFDIDLDAHSISLLNTTEVIEVIGDTAVIEKYDTEKEQPLSWNQRKEQIFEKYPDSIVTKWIELDNAPPSLEIVDEMNRLIPEFFTYLKPSELTQSVFFHLTEEEKEKFEINKPSELCQIVCMDENKNLNGELTSTQMDIMNLLLYKSREKIIKENISTADEFFELGVELQYLNSALEKNSNGDYKRIIEQLTKLQKQQFVINALGKNKDLETTITSFIHKLNFSRHKENYKKMVRIVLDGEIVNMVVKTKKYFSKMFLSIQFSMVSKYSKALYEILKDYENIKQLIVTMDLLFGLLNVNISKPTNTVWSTFRVNVLERAIAEINEKSDIQVSYEPIKEKIEGQRKQVTHIKFNIQKQPESRLQELGLIQPDVSTHRFYNKSKTKLDKLVAGGYTVIDEDMWIQTDIKKNEGRYDAEMRIDTWLRETDTQQKNQIFMQLASQLPDCEDPTVIIDNYKLIGVFSKDVFTKNPTETIALMNQIIQETVQSQ